MSMNGKKKPSAPKTDPNAILGVYGMVPPHEKEIEMAVLGQVMIEKQAIDVVIEIVHSPEVFYVPDHQMVWEAISDLYRQNMPTDLRMVANRMKEMGTLDQIGGPFGLTKLTNNVVSSASIEIYCIKLVEKWMKRQLGVLGAEMMSMSYDPGVDDVQAVDVAEKGLMDITNAVAKRPYSTMEGPIMNIMKRIDAAIANPQDFIGVPSGYKALDNITKGWRKSDLIILAARPSVGKTAFALNLARNAATHPIKPTKVGIFSLEMSKDQLVERMLSAETEIWLEKIATGRMEQHVLSQLYRKGSAVAIQWPILIDDTASMNIFTLKSKIRKMVKDGAGLIIIDYLQLMSGLTSDRGQNREQEISTISRNLKIMAKEMDVPIIALSQLSREVEKRKEGNKMPQLSDLRESGAIEQDADIVMFLYRPEYYEMMSDAEGESTKGQTLLKIAKHRNGVLETVRFRAELHIQKFVEDEGTASGWMPKSNAVAQNWTPIKDNLDDLL